MMLIPIKIGMCWNVFNDFFCSSTLFRLLIKIKKYIYFVFLGLSLFVVVFFIVVLYRSLKFWYRDNPIWIKSFFNLALSYMSLLPRDLWLVLC